MSSKNPAISGEKRASFFKKTDDTPKTNTRKLAKADVPENKGLSVSGKSRQPKRAKPEVTADDLGGDSGFSGNTTNEFAKRAEYRARERLSMQIPKKVKDIAKQDYIDEFDSSWTALLIEGMQLVGKKRGIDSLANIPDWDVLNRNNR